jgi:hypothetical protein
MCSSGDASDDYADEQREAQRQREARIRTGMTDINSQFSRFDDSFYNGQSQAYLDFAMPQINQQYDNAYRGLVFALARQGIGGSSEGNRRYGNLSQDYGLQRQGAVDRSRTVAQDSRRAIEDARSGVIQDLYATADPAAAAQAATSRAQYLSTPASFSPVGTLFANALDGLNTYQAYRQDADAYNAAMQAYGLPGAPTSSGRNYGGGGG